jgi:DNA-binding Xre family transcriptional regulator
MRMAARFILRELMDEKGIEQVDLAAEAKVSFATVHRLYHNQTKQVSLKTLDKILKALRRRGMSDVGLDTIIEWK